MSAAPASPAAAPKCRGSDTRSHGYRVTVEPAFAPHQSDTKSGKFVFTYRIGIVNESGDASRLERRYWRIVDANGVESEVDGEGVVGEMPEFKTGERFDYASFCPLGTHWGTMEGRYTLVVTAGPRTGQRFDIDVGRFYLVGPKRD